MEPASSSSRPCAPRGVDREIPRIIWILWFDGWEKAPELHQRCLESWRLFNPSWEVRAISRQDLPALLGDFLPRYERLRAAMNPLEKFGGFWIPPAAESDLLRLALLVYYGGVWVDSTMLCRRPLESWLPQRAASGFFAFSPESVSEKLPVMSSFLAAAPGHVIVAAWLRRAIDHWLLPTAKRSDLGFFWVHQLFGQITSSPELDVQAGEEEARAAWQAVPHLSGEYGVQGPHYWVPYRDSLPGPPDASRRAAIFEDEETAMWKLTNHEVKLSEVGPESCYRILLEETRRRARLHRASAA